MYQLIVVDLHRVFIDISVINYQEPQEIKLRLVKKYLGMSYNQEI